MILTVALAKSFAFIYELFPTTIFKLIALEKEVVCMISTKATQHIRLIDFIIFTIGTALYGWSLINVNIPNKLAEGGISGITLIIRALTGFNPAYSTLLLNIPLLIIGFRMLGRKSLIYTIYGIAVLSFWLWFWQHVSLPINLHHDIFVSALVAGLLAGVGSGIIYRFGGTTGGTDVIARIFEQHWGIPMGRTLFILDCVVLFASLVYIDINHIVYTLIASFVFAQVVNFSQEGAYSARAFMVFTSKPDEISQAIMLQLGRGTSFIKAEGGYSHNDQRVVYAVIDPSEMNTAREIIKEIDDRAFVTILNVQETLGEGFTYDRPKKKMFRLS